MFDYSSLMGRPPQTTEQMMAQMLMQQGSSWTFLSVGARRDYRSVLRKQCGNRTSDRLTSDGGASADAIPSVAGACDASPNGDGANPSAFGGASPNDAGGPNAHVRASAGPNALLPARGDRPRPG